MSPVTFTEMHFLFGGQHGESWSKVPARPGRLFSETARVETDDAMVQTVRALELLGCVPGDDVLSAGETPASVLLLA